MRPSLNWVFGRKLARVYIVSTVFVSFLWPVFGAQAALEPVTIRYNLNESHDVAAFRRKSLLHKTEHTEELDKKLYEHFFDEQMSNQFVGHYHASVKPIEEEYTRDNFHTREETKQYYERKSQIVTWTQNEMLKNKLPRVLLSGVDQESRLVQFLGVVRKLLGSNGYDFVFERDRPEHIYRRKPARQKKLNEMTREERYNHLQGKLHGMAGGIFGSKAPGPEKFRIRGKWNTLRTRGHLKIQNPVINTKFEVNFKERDYELGQQLHLNRGDRYTLMMERDIHQLNMYTYASYGLQTKKLEINLAQKITENISANISTRRITDGEYRVASGKRYDERVQMRYSINF